MLNNIVTTNTRLLELYSIKRNRNIYPLPSSFEVNFAPTIQSQNHCGDRIVQDPVCKGPIYYKFGWTPQNDEDTKDYVSFTQGYYGPETTQASPMLYFTLTGQESLSFEYPDYFVGFKIYNLIGGELGESRTITSYNPATNKVTLNRPFETPLVLNDLNNGFAIFSILPGEWSIYIPTVDNNQNVVKRIPLYYNGYYVVFESPNINYSNSTNSNIFYRRISYYDYTTQLAYFDQPLPFTYTGSNLPDFQQTWTLRKSLPLERWILNKTTYYNKEKPVNSIIGPLQGYVVILPDEASSVDNYYKGKYIYIVSNGAQTYTPPLPPQTEILPIQGGFFPIYGLFYIRAYNGSTRECSIESVQNKFDSSYNTNNQSNMPTYKKLNYNSDSFNAGAGVASITNLGGDVYRATAESTIVPIDGEYNMTLLLPLKRKNTHLITFRVRQSNVMTTETSYFYTVGGTYSFYSYDKKPSKWIETTYNTYTFDMTMNSDIDTLEFVFAFKLDNPDDLSEVYFEWDFLEVFQFDVIDIVELAYDNYSPLDYNGTMVGTNETVCYDMSIVSVTLPNKPLLTGSIIAFYPFIYVQIENATSPTRVSNNTIISNNPASSKAVFTLYIPQVNSPDLQSFVTLFTAERQIVKFKPNDNLRFSIYLPDGSPFETLLPDNFPPYPPDPSIQVQAVFNLIRMSTISD